MTAPKRIWLEPAAMKAHHHTSQQRDVAYFRADLVAELVQAAETVLQMHIAHHNATQHAALRAALVALQEPSR